MDQIIKHQLILEIGNNKMTLKYAEYNIDGEKISEHPTTNYGEKLYNRQANFAEELRKELGIPKTGLKLEGRVVHIRSPFVKKIK